MGSIMSPIKEIDNIWWKDCKAGTPYKAKRVVIVPGTRDPSHQLMIVELEDGSFLSSRDMSKYAYIPGKYPWLTATLKALKALGAITQKAINEHLAHVDNITALEENERRHDDLLTAAYRLGLTLTEYQQTQIDTNLSRRDRRNYFKRLEDDKRENPYPLVKPPEPVSGRIEEPV